MFTDAVTKFLKKSAQHTQRTFLRRQKESQKKKPCSAFDKLSYIP